MKKFFFTLKSTDSIRLPLYKGSAFRGGFGHAFKKVVCTVRNRSCDKCLLKTRCIYSYVFETPPPEDSEILRNYSKAPHPFIIEPPLTKKRTWFSEEALTFELVLIGKAVDYLPYFIYTFEELGRIGIGKGKGKYTLEEVICDGEEIYNSEDKKLKSVTNDHSILSFLSANIPAIHNLQLSGGLSQFTDEAERSRRIGTVPQAITLNFLTPARIIFREDLVVEPEFHHIIRTLLRRLSSLSYFHCGERLDLDFKGLVERAGLVKTVKCDTRWYDWERYSSRQNTRMKMGGILGRVAFEGDLEEFVPFIRLGEMLHAGKGTSFGLGKYEIVATL